MNNSKMKLNDIIGSEAYWQVNKCLAQNIGLYETILLQDLINKDAYFDKLGQLVNGEWFFNTFENIENDTTLSRYMCQKPLKKLITLGFLETKLMGIPAKKHFKINHDAIIYALSNKAVFKKVENLNSKRLKRINKNKENKNKDNKNKKSDSASFQAARASFQNYLSRELTEKELTSIRLNIHKDIGINGLIGSFNLHMIEECIDINQLDQDAKTYGINIVGFIYMYYNDIEKFEEILKGIG